MSAMESNFQKIRFQIAATGEFEHGLEPLASNNNREGQNFEDHSSNMVIENSSSRLNQDGEHQDGAVSDSESGVSGTINGEQPELFGHGLIKIEENDRLHQVIKLKFVVGMKDCVGQVEAIHKNVYSSLRKQSMVQSFLIFSKAMEQNLSGNANVKYAWYGASKDEIVKIISHGFGDSLNNGVYGRGVYFSPSDYPLDSLQSSVVDEDGMRHMLLCRVILGRIEVIKPGSGQSYPSSEDYDTGVDNLESPRKYIVWSSHMNTHILPEFVISFRDPISSKARGQKISIPIKKPNSPWMPFPTLISELSKVLPLDSIKLIKKHHSEHREKRITRHDLIQRVRLIVGDHLLAAVIKSYREKHSTRKPTL